ncbi:portal protein [Janthinobacterium sp. PSPC3-1]|uniref:portal protein n=1 Tax=Janthinobacterium sp. PSPC3-1 TaxID=2804653 RepID=UPI003CEDD32A
MDEFQEAQDLYEDALNATREQRLQIEEDLRFSDPSNPQQWDEAVKRSREQDPGGARPCLVMDHVGQYVANVAGQVTKSPPAIHTVPVGSGADVKVSEQLDGMLRHIEYASRAQAAYGIALTSAARTGVGYLVVRPEYVDRALGYQEPRISAIADPLRVVFDPWSVQLDGSDAGFGYLLTAVSEREFERKYGAKAEKKSFGERQAHCEGQRQSIIVAEQWYKEEKTRHVSIWTGADGEDQAGTEDEYWAACQAAGVQLPLHRVYKDKYECVKWRTMSGAGILEAPKNTDGSEGLYPADSIGIVPVYGYWGVENGVMRYCGIPRRAMNPQRAYNYHKSEQLAYMGSAPKAPWVASRRAIAGLEPLWDRASLDSRAYLPYNDLDERGQPITAPTRPNVSVNLQNHVVGAAEALHDLEASIGMYQANLGAPSNESSGVAIDARKQQGEASTSHFPQNLAFSLGQVGRITVQMSAKLIDTKRQQRIMGIDMKPGTITIDPEQAEAMQDTDEGIIINPNVGDYDVRVVVGSSFSTQRSQAQTALGEVMRTNPDLTPAIAPLWARNLDIPHADKLAQVLTAMAPPAVQAILDPEANKTPKPEQLMQQMKQMEESLKEALKHAHDAQAEADEAMEEVHNKREENEAKARELNIKAYDAETKRLQLTSAAMTPEQIQLMVAQTVEAMLSNPTPLPNEAPQQIDPATTPVEQPAPQEHAQPEPDPNDPGQMDAQAPPGLPDPNDPAAMQAPPNPPSAGFSLPEPQPGA